MTMKWGIYVTTANRPDETQRAVFERSETMAQAAEELGYDGVWLLEHHFTKYGLCPSPLLMASHILGATRRIRVGTAVTVIPLDHPVRLAENVALVDQLSRGRVCFGIGRGYFFKDYEVLGADISKNHEMMSVWMDIMMQAWTTGKCSADNEFLKFPEVNIYPEPYTKPHPPVYVACSSPTRTEWAAERGLPMLMDYLKEDEEKIAQLDLYREVASGAGHDPDAVDHLLSCIAYVGDASLAQRIRSHLVWWEHEGLRASQLFAPEHRNVQNYGYYFRQRESAMLRGDWTPEQRCERVLELSPTGSPEQCIERLQHSVELTGIRHVVLGFEGLGEKNLVLESMQRFMEEVAPNVGAQPRAAASHASRRRAAGTERSEETAP